MKIKFSVFLVCLSILLVATQSAAKETSYVTVMEGFPPTRSSQATMKNYREYPISQWTFSNAGAPLNVVMIPREGKILELGEPTQPNLGNFLVPDSAGKTMAFEELFGQNYADGVVVGR